MREREGPTPEEMGEETKPGMGRREFLKGLAGFGAAVGSAREAKGEPQQSKEKNRTEKQKDVAEITRQAQGFDVKEESEYKKYIQAKKDSEEERNLFDELGVNHRALRKLLDKLLDYQVDEDGIIADQAIELYQKLENNINRRRKECEVADKRYFDRPSAPLLTRPRE